MPNKTIFESYLETWDFDDWIAFGIKMGFCGPPVCSTHDGIPTSEEEDEQWEEFDPCIHVIRPYTEESHKIAVEINHAPSKWRDTWSHPKYPECDTE